ncbi:hypothetical protein SNE40_009427 [Patella caerulea]|uniref:Uncharacterized protein n=1 Tax=Patella caerulea TaxID=87958 RepID=A0AAN8Q387_PATCE
MTDNDVISSIVDVHKTKVTQGQYAYVGDMIALQSFMKANNCSLHIIKEKFLPLYYSVALPMNSSLRDVISKEIIRITESGLVTMWMKKWLGNDNQCSHTPSSSVAAAKILSLIDVQAAFYVVCIGIVVSCCVLLFERLIRLFIVKTVGLNRR